MTPILRWAGSKRRIVSLLASEAPTRFNTYHEPFAGSAVLYFHLMPKVAVLGDLNPEVIYTYAAIKKSPEEVGRYLYSIPKNKESYLTIRQLNPETLADAQRAARLIFLMKACFNGVYRTNKQGQFNVPLGSRFYALPDLEHLRSVSETFQNVEMVRGDFETSLNAAKENDFIYLDPPYSDSLRFRGEYSYEGAFSKHDKDRLLTGCVAATQRGVKIMLSFKWDTQIEDCLAGWSVKRLNVPRSVAGFAANRILADEMLVKNY